MGAVVGGATINSCLVEIGFLLEQGIWASIKEKVTKYQSIFQIRDVTLQGWVEFLYEMEEYFINVLISTNIFIKSQKCSDSDKGFRY